MERESWVLFRDTLFLLLVGVPIIVACNCAMTVILTVNPPKNISDNTCKCIVDTYQAYTN